MDETLKQLLAEIFRLTTENNQLRVQLSGMIDAIRPPARSAPPSFPPHHRDNGHKAGDGAHQQDRHEFGIAGANRSIENED
jgi:hypothetical protein